MSKIRDDRQKDLFRPTLEHPATRPCMQFEELEDQRGQQHSEGDQPDSDKGRFQDFLSPPLMLWPGVVHYRFLTAGCHRERSH